MGYWATSLSGASLQIVGDLNPDGSEMLWGDAPADRIDAGMNRLIIRLRAELGRFPTVAELDAVKSTAPEMVEAIEAAGTVFAQDVGRHATDGEIAAGLLFANTEIGLDAAIRDDIRVGDRVRWAVMRRSEDGFWQEVDHIAEGEVIGMEDRRVKSSWSDSHFIRKMLVVRREDSIDDVNQAHANKVLPDDEALDEVNARYRRIAERGPLDDDDVAATDLTTLMYNRNMRKDDGGWPGRAT